MKKIVSMLVMSAMVLMSTAALADSYDITGNEVTADASGYKTVIIYKDNAENVVYVGQAVNTFGAAAEFLLKNTADADGVYTLKLGGRNGSTVPAEKKFYVGTAGLVGAGQAKEMTRVQDNPETPDVDESMVQVGDKYNIGYTVEASFGICRSILIEKNDGTVMGYGLDTNLTGEATAKLGVQINDVPASEKDTLKVYVSGQSYDNTTSTFDQTKEVGE